MPAGVRGGGLLPLVHWEAFRKVFQTLDSSQALRSKKNRRNCLLLLHVEALQEKKKKKTGCIVLKFCTWGQVSLRRFPGELNTKSILHASLLILFEFLVERVKLIKAHDVPGCLGSYLARFLLNP